MAEFSFNRFFLSKSKSTTTLSANDENRQEADFNGIKNANSKGIKRKFMEISNKFDLMPSRPPKMVTRAVNRAINRATLASTPIDFDGAHRSSIMIPASLKTSHILRSVQVPPKNDFKSSYGLRKW